MKALAAWTKFSILLTLACGTACGEPALPAGGKDNILAEAERRVRASDRYMHHSKLRRGMKGYGLTVMKGVKIVRFDVEIVSVLTGWGPHQDVILARLSGKDVDGVDIEKSGVISGMSGSPVYVPDGDGKAKLIGAVSYGWYAQKEAQCGIQPITQMIAVSGFLPGSPGASGEGRGVAERSQRRAAREYLAAVLNPRKTDFAGLFRPKPLRWASQGNGACRLAPLKTPLMMPGAGPRVMARARRAFGPLGIVPVQAGAVGEALAGEAAGAKLQPGAAVALALVRGDADFSAVGTVTDVVDGRILCLGHGVLGEGDVCLPIGTAYVHTVVSRLDESFKLGSTLKITGALTRDEYVGVCGRLGERAPMLPVAITIKWVAEGRTQRYNFEICRHRWLTPALADVLICGVAWGWRELPEQHTVRYSAEVDFGRLGRYRAANISSGRDIFDVTSDVCRPLAALLNNPFGEPPNIKGIKLDLEIEPVDRRAEIIDLKLDGRIFRPGETVKGTLAIREYRKPRRFLPISFELPADLAEGSYTLAVCDSESALSRLQSEMPHKFDPRSTEELFRVLQRVVEPRASKLYLSIPLSGGVAIDKRELPDLPASKARIISEAASPDSQAFMRSLVREIQTDCVVAGSAGAEFVVSERPREILIRKQEEPK